jgi:hypothetical protein
LIEGVDVEPAANEIGDDVGLEIGEGQDEIGLQGENFVDIRRDECAHAWLFAASVCWAHDIPRDTDNSVLLAEQVQRLDGFFGEADNSARREHSTIATINSDLRHGSTPRA